MKNGGVKRSQALRGSGVDIGAILEKILRDFDGEFVRAGEMKRSSSGGGGCHVWVGTVS